MIICQVEKRRCQHLKEISFYNHNYYKLPNGIKYKGCDVLYEEANDEDNSLVYILGEIRKLGNHKTFIPRIRFYEDFVENADIFLLDTDNIEMP